MIVPSPVGGSTTETVGFFNLPAESLAIWLCGRLGSGWATSRPQWAGLDDLLVALAPDRDWSRTRYGLVPIDGEWTAFFNNTVLGTDVGVLPIHAAELLGVRAIRAVCSADDAKYPARILEVYGPDGSGPLNIRRTITAANDGGRWVFETSGEPFEFEDQTMYSSRRKSDRFTREALGRYLKALHVPVDLEPIWDQSVLVERKP